MKVGVILPDSASSARWETADRKYLTDAFAAAEFLMDWLKTKAPFWKKEERPGEAGWVAAKDTDDAAAARWEPGTTTGSK